MIITLGDKGAFFANDRENFHIKAMNLGENCYMIWTIMQNPTQFNIENM